MTESETKPPQVKADRERLKRLVHEELNLRYHALKVSEQQEMLNAVEEWLDSFKMWVTNVTAKGIAQEILDNVIWEHEHPEMKGKGLVKYLSKEETERLYPSRYQETFFGDGGSTEQVSGEEIRRQVKLASILEPLKSKSRE
jgi:hypothetical protein